MNLKIRNFQIFKLMLGLYLMTFSLLSAEIIVVNDDENLQEVIDKNNEVTHLTQ